LPLGSILLLVVLGGLLLIGIWFAKYRMKRTLQKVIKIFRENGALDPGSAKSRKELGLQSLAERGFFERAFKRRDDKPYLFDMLTQMEIVLIVGDEKYYLSEQALKSSDISDH